MDFPFRYYSGRQTIPSGLNPKILLSKGNIFDSSYGFDGIVVFLPPNMGLFNHEYDYFVANKEPMHHKLPVFMYGYDWRCMPSLKSCEIKGKVNEALDCLSQHKCKRIGFHGIRTYDISEYKCEAITIDAVNDWIEQNMTAINTITLVDYRGGYNRHSLS